MKTPKEKYQHDVHYHTAVDSMVNLIHQCKYTPSELREMAILASIIYEEQQVHEVRVAGCAIDHKLENAFKTFDNWLSSNSYGGYK